MDDKQLPCSVETCSVETYSVETFSVVISLSIHYKIKHFQVWKSCTRSTTKRHFASMSMYMIVQVATILYTIIIPCLLSSTTELGVETTSFHRFQESASVKKECKLYNYLVGWHGYMYM